MKNEFLKFSSKRILFSAAMISAICLGSPQQVFAEVHEVQAVMQSGKIKGTVTDANGEPIIGANIKVKGGTGGSVTDLDGNFSLTAKPGTTLVVSYIGFRPQEVVVKGNETNLKIVLHEDSEQLNEVVVVGYGSQKKATLTGSVTVVDSKMLENKGTMSSPVQALQGQVPGVIITRSSSAPGDESWGMSLRGAVSKNSTSPLIIIDGVEYESVNELRLLNPSDIESINFLKDASASIYGSKAAGGVVLVTTKKAKDGKTTVTYSGSVTGKFVGLRPEMMTLDEWANSLIDARTNDGYGNDDYAIQWAKLALANKGSYVNVKNPGDNPIAGNFTNVKDYTFFDTNWSDILWGSAASTQHELAISGGTEKSLYRLSVGYMYDDSNLKWGNNSNTRYNLRLSNTFKLTDKFTIESTIAYNRQDQVAPTQLSQVFAKEDWQPGYPTETLTGKPYSWGGNNAPNWYAEAGGDNNLKVSAINISETFNYKFSNDFMASVTAGYNTSTAMRDTKSLAIDWYNYEGDILVSSDPTEEGSSYYKSSSRTDFYSLSGFLQWSHSFGDHNLKVMGGAQYNLKEFDKFETTAKNIIPSLETINGSGETTTSGTKWHEALMSYFGRVNYDYRSRYMLEAQARYDGSSKFQPENRWKAFWGVSAGWRLTEEAFLKDVSFLNELKLRLSYGNVGNQSGIDRYDGIQLYNLNLNNGPLLGSGNSSYISTNGKLVSLNRTWERIHNYNVALDFGLFDSRLTGTVELFWKKNNNMLIGVTYPSILGDTAPDGNDGKFKAYGYEGQATWSDKIGEVNYHVGGTFTFAKNELVDNGGSTVLNSGVVSNREGYPLNSVFGLRYCGKIQTQEQLDKYVKRYATNSTIGVTNALRLGDNMFEDVNKDGKLNEEDYVYLGTDDPQIQFSFNAGLEWKGFDLNVIFQGAGKRTIFRNTSWKVPMRSWYKNSTNQAVGNTWSTEHRDAYYPTLTTTGSLNNYNYQISSWSVEDGSYLRLKNVTLGYNFPTNWLTKTHFLSKVRLYVTGTDLWEKTNIHDGWDPEAGRNLEGTGTQRFPFTRNVTFGAEITF